MNLKGNNIDNLEIIKYLNIPTLMTLELYDNNIRNLQPLFNNNNLINLKTLTIYNNPLRQITNIHKMLSK